MRVASRPASLAKPSCNFAHSPAPACPPHIVPGSRCVGNWPPYPAVGHSGGHSLGQQPAPASVPPFPLLDPQTPLPGRWLPLKSQLPKKLPTLTGYTPSHRLLSPAQALARSLAGPSADTGHHWVFFKAPGTCSWSYCFPLSTALRGQDKPVDAAPPSLRTWPSVLLSKSGAPCALALLLPAPGPTAAHPPASPGHRSRSPQATWPPLRPAEPQDHRCFPPSLPALVTCDPEPLAPGQLA